MSQEKKQWMETLLETSWVMVLFDPRKEKVQLPEYLKKETHVALQYGYHMPIPIRDFQIDDQGISATLSFQQRFSFTFVPWSAVFAISDGEQKNKVWEKDIPTDLDLPPTHTSGPLQPAQTESVLKPKARPSHLKIVD